VKRSQAVFVTVVFTTLLTGFLVERTHREDPAASFAFVAPSEEARLERLETVLGTETLRATVVSDAGEPVEGALVHLLPTEAHEGAAPLAWALSDAGGAVELGRLHPGAYRALLYHVDTPNAVHDVTVGDGAAAELVLRLPPPHPPLETLPALERADLVGSLLPERTPGAPLPAELSLTGYEIVLEPVEGTDPLTGALVRRTTSGPDGSFAVERLALGTYRAKVLPPWARGGSWPVLAEALHEHATGSEGPRLELATASIRGRLRDRLGRAIEGALVRVWELEHENRVWPPATTDSEGRFQVGDLPAGSYRASIRAGGAQVEREVELEAGDTVELALPDLELRTVATPSD